MKEIFRNHGLLIVLLFIQTFVFRQWLFADSFFTFGDVGVYTNETQRDLLSNALSVYISDTGFGNINIAASSNPLLFVFGLLAFFGVNAIWSMKFIIFYPTVYGVIISSYFLIRKLTGSLQGAFFGALLYAYSTYFIITLTGALYLSLAYALSPLILLTFLRVLENQSFSRKVQLACTAAFVGYIEFRVLYINMIFLSIYFLVDLFLRKQTVREILNRVYQFVIPAILFILLNLFWLLPLMLAGNVSSNVLFNRGLFGDSYFDILNALAVFHPWWTGSVPAIFEKQIVPFFFYLVPVIGALTLFTPHRRKSIPFLILFLLGVLFTKQSAEPFQSLYLWFYTIIPGFNAFREASKFYLMSTLSLVILVGFALAWCTQQKKRIMKASIVTLISLFLLIQIFPVADGSLQTMFIPRNFPEEYRVLNELLNRESLYYRILWLPHTSRFGANSTIHPSVSLLLNMESNFKEFIDPNLSKFVDALASPLNDERFPDYLNRASVRYIVVPSNLQWDDVDSPWKNPENYTYLLDKLPFLFRIEDRYLESRGIVVYENRTYHPHIYLSSQKPEYQTVSEVLNVDFRSIRPTEYQVSIKNLDKPHYLNFSDNFHPDWQLRGRDFHWFDQFFVPNHLLPDSYHVKNDFGMNSFYLDPEIIKNKFPYTEHDDGSIDFEATVVYRPQSYYFLGLGVSGSILFLCTLYILYDIVIIKKGLIKGRKL